MRAFGTISTCGGSLRNALTTASTSLLMRIKFSRWRRELETKAETSFPGQGKVIYTPEQEEIHRLKKELLDMRQERDILRKAMASSPGAMANIPVPKRPSDNV